MTGPTALGIGMMFISLIFCDSGPFQKCAEAGLMFLGGLLFCAALPVPALIALIRNKNPLGWYMYVYPFLMRETSGTEEVKSHCYKNGEKPVRHSTSGDRFS